MIYRIRHNPTGLYWKGEGGNKRLAVKPKYFTTYPKKDQWGSLPKHKGEVTRIKDYVVETLSVNLLKQEKLR